MFSFVRYDISPGDIFSGFRLIRNKGKGRKDDLTLDKVGGRIMCNKYVFERYLTYKFS